MSFHDAYLVESFRDETNNPRQRTISYLGNIRQLGDEFPTIERALFFLRAERILSTIPGLDGPEREQVLHLLREKVPPLSDAEVLEAFRNNLRWYNQWWRDRGVRLTHQDLLALVNDADEGPGPL